MKKIFTSILTALFLTVLPAMALAERDVNKDENYNFKTVRQAEITDITFPPYSAREYQEDFGAEQKVSAALQTALSSRNIKTLGRTAQVSISVNVEALGVWKEYIAAYDETTTVDKKTVAKDENGKDVIVTIPTQQIVHHDAKEVPHAVAILSFTVTDNKTGQVIFTSTDSRERADEDDTSGMLGRICKEFAKEISKN